MAWWWLPLRRDWPSDAYQAPTAEASEGKNRVLHGDVEDGAEAGARAAHEGGGDCRVEVDAAEEIAQRRTGLQRWFAVVTGDGHDAGHGLNGDVHGPVVAMRPPFVRIPSRPRRSGRD